MKTSTLTLRVPVTLKERIKSSARKHGLSSHRWSLEALARAASSAEDTSPNWDEHFAWLHKHGPKLRVDAADAQRQLER